MQRPLMLALSLPILVMTGGCNALRVDAPSLLPRPIESRSDAEPVRTIVETPPDAAFASRIVAAEKGFDDATKGFAAVLKTAEPRIAASAKAASGSDAWIDAQAALGELGGARGTTDAALADLEELAIARGSAGLPPLAALDTRIAAANAEVDRQSEVVERLKAIPRPL